MIAERMGWQWINWDGGKCPVDPDKPVEVKFRNGDQQKTVAGLFLWNHDGSHYDIVAYRIAAPKSAASDLLTIAAKHMAERASTYDTQGGERSMAKTIEVFNAYHGTNLTEAQGWHFMQILKDVRLFTRSGYHSDSAEDCIAYAALKAEAKKNEGA